MLTRDRVDVLTTNQDSLWQEILERIGRYDCYHLPAYHRLAELQGEGEAVLFVYDDGRYTVALPLLMRSVEVDGFVSSEDGHRDATSVYGYPGPVASVALPPEIRERFSEHVHDFLKQSRIVCAFSRLNPVLDNGSVMQLLGEVSDMGPTLSVDLTTPPEIQYEHYRRSYKKNINTLIEMGVTCRECGVESVNHFVRLYHETMDRIGAEDYYYFGTDYFTNLLTMLPGVAHLFLCWHGDIAISGMVALSCNGIIQGHLGGCLNEYLHLAPMKLAYEGVRQWGNSIGAHTFHIGGGIGGRRDSLFNHKQGFTKREHMFQVWQCVVDHDLYDDLYEQQCRNCKAKPEEPYFPLYRNPAFRAVRSKL